MRVLIACEFSGVVRRAFRALGHDAWSCDLLPAEDDDPYHHYQDDINNVLGSGKPWREGYWDLLIAHPPCTYLTTSAAWAFGDGPYHQRVKPGTLVGGARRKARAEALEFVKFLWAVPIERIAIENPRGFLSTMFRSPSQTIQPHEFGHDASKGTCLWLKGLPPLRPTNRIAGRIVVHNGREVERWANQTDSGQNKLTPSEDRWALRSITYPGIAEAMAQQWGSL